MRGEAYAGCRDRITQLVRAADGAAKTTAVPACPGWTVHDVVSHLSGGIEDALAGNLEGAGTDPWTAVQVKERRDAPTAHLLDVWNDKAPQIERVLDDAGDMGRQGVTDVVTHEHDIRGALGQPGARDSAAVFVALGFAADQLIAAAATLGISLRVRTTGGLDFGPADAEVTLIGDTFELMRAMTGRRSVDQLRKLRWRGFTEAVIPAFSWLSLSPAASHIDE